MSSRSLGENAEQEGEASTSSSNQTTTDDGKLVFEIIFVLPCAIVPGPV